MTFDEVFWAGVYANIFTTVLVMIMGYALIKIIKK